MQRLYPKMSGEQPPIDQTKWLQDPAEKRDLGSEADDAPAPTVTATCHI